MYQNQIIRSVKHVYRLCCIVYTYIVIYYVHINSARYSQIQYLFSIYYKLSRKIPCRRLTNVLANKSIILKHECRYL